LIVEDDEDIRVNLSDILKRRGWEVSTSANGVEALAELRAHRHPSVILLDMRMPVMNGWEFLAAAKEELTGIPVIICSGDGNVDPEALAAAGCLRKPFELSSLFSMLQPYR
jgi:CheY-like chemotaxis protein